MADTGASGMGDNPSDNLDRALRSAFSRMERPVEPVPDDVLLAYVQGTASEADVRKVWSALIGSPELASQLLELAKDLEAFDQEDSLKRWRSALIPPLPMTQDGDSQIREPMRVGLWDRVRDSLRLFTRPRVLIPAAALVVAVLLVASLPQLWSTWTQVQLQADAGLVLTARDFTLWRGSEDSGVEPTHAAAVRSVVVQSLEPKGRDYVWRGTAGTVAEGAESRTLRVRVTGESGNVLAEGVLHYPVNAGESRIYIVSTPTLENGYVGVGGDRVNVTWSGPEDATLYAIVSYAAESGFRATWPRELSRRGQGTESR